MQNTVKSSEETESTYDCELSSNGTFQGKISIERRGGGALENRPEKAHHEAWVDLDLRNADDSTDDKKE
jgi:hypothetical protein